ncbi:MAG: hypothetical protein EA393_04760 [Bacteroidetes bacterium]|nr:MAG: hypothetical protein EA393_04760 [Bacteroidota bacterium]
MEKIFSHAKLILMGEYAVLHGADAVCLPLKTGQLLKVNEDNSTRIKWKWTWNEQILADFILDTETLQITENPTGKPDWAVKLIKLIRQSNPDFLRNKGCSLHFENYFPPQWGLGSSSATISSLCRLAGVNAYPVNEKLMGGSGADIACTTAKSWFLYRKKLPLPQTWHIPFEYPFLNNTFFIYSGQKKDTAGHLKEMSTKKNSKMNADWLKINEYVYRFLAPKETSDLLEIIEHHELFISGKIGIEPVANQFSDFQGGIKSLGAWGGDFLMAVSMQPAAAVRKYFIDKGFTDIFLWKDFVEANEFGDK